VKNQAVAGRFRGETKPVAGLGERSGRSEALEGTDVPRLRKNFSAPSEGSNFLRQRHGVNRSDSKDLIKLWGRVADWYVICVQYSSLASAASGRVAVLLDRLFVSLGRILLGVTVSVVLATETVAATLTLGLDVEFSGATPPVSGTTPWVTATFDDSFGGPNTVRLTMTADNLTGGGGGENLELFFFNFDPLLDPTLLTFSAIDTSASNPENGQGDNGIFTGVNAFMADGDGNYDIQFNFPPPPGGGGNRFTGGESVIYDITYTSAIDANSFNFFSDEGGGQGTFLAAAHIQRINGNDSGWIGVVPEPATGMLLGGGLFLLGLNRRRRPSA
jgi:hypothetical protein